MRTNKLISTLLNSIILILLFMAAVSHNGKFFGKKTSEFWQKSDVKLYEPPSSSNFLEENQLAVRHKNPSQKGIWKLENHQGDKAGVVINSSKFSESVYGYAGPIPMYIYLSQDSVIKNIEVLPNQETPRFLNNVINRGVVDQWIGKSISDLTTFQPDAVSGATLSSDAINKSITQSIYGMQSIVSENTIYLSWKNVAALFIIVLGVVMSFFAPKKKVYRLLQLILNTLVLGFWCGKFISLQIIIGWIANGINLTGSLVVFVMLILAVVIPLFTKQRQYYCNWICPFGSAQELVGKLNKRKLNIPESVFKFLKFTRVIITALVFFLLWIGIATDIVDYEPFSAFLFQQAEIIVLVIAVLSLLTSLFVNRPYCRFVCPTGEVLSWIHRME